MGNFFILSPKIYTSIEDEMSIKKNNKKIKPDFHKYFQDYYHYFIFDLIIIYKPNSD